MIKVEVDSKEKGSRKIVGAFACHAWEVQMEKFTIEGSGEQLMSEMSAVVGRLLLEMVGDTMDAVGEKDFETFCALIERTSKTIMINAMANVSSRWAEEHGISVKEEELYARYCAGLICGAAEKKAEEQTDGED